MLVLTELILISCLQVSGKYLWTPTLLNHTREVIVHTWTSAFFTTMTPPKSSSGSKRTLTNTTRKFLGYFSFFSKWDFHKAFSVHHNNSAPGDRLSEALNYKVPNSKYNDIWMSWRKCGANPWISEKYSKVPPSIIKGIPKKERWDTYQPNLCIGTKLI